MKATTQPNRDPRIEQILGMVRRLAGEPQEIRAAPSGPREALDEVITGLNHVAEKLAAQQEALARSQEQLQESRARYRMLVETQQQAAEALRRSEKRLSAFITDAPVGLVILDEKLRYRRVNESLARINGVPVDEHQGKTPSEVLLGEYGARVEAMLRRVLETGEPALNEEMQGETAFRPGVISHFIASIFPIGGQDHPTGVASIVLDVTEHKQAEVALQENEHKLKEAQRIARVGNWSVDLQTHEVEGSVEFYRLFGVDTATFDGKAETLITTRMHPEDQQGASGALEGAMLRGERVDYDFRIIWPDGTLLFVHAQGEGKKDATGHLARWVGTLQDITEGKQAERALRASQERLQLILQATHEGIWEWDIEADTAFFSPGWFTSLGYKPNEFEPGFEAWQRLLHPDDLPRIMEAVQHHLEGRTPFYECEHRLLTKSGQWLWAYDRGRVVARDEEGAPLRVVGAWVDITERKRAEAEREELIAILEVKNAELERFTYTVSHDLKSPLVTIKGFLGLLQEDAARGDAERVNRDVTQIVGAADKMARLLDELLKLSRIGHQMNPPEAVSLTEVARDAVDLVAGKIQARGVSVEIDPMMPVVSGDRVRLLEVYQNLLENAVKFMGDQTDPCVQVGGRRDGEYVLCFVQDNGMGINPMYHEKVFGLFNRLDQRIEGGTGVGLALVKRIVEVHGGRIWVESEGEGHGSTFLFTLPLHGSDHPTQGSQTLEGRQDERKSKSSSSPTSSMNVPL